MFHLKAPIVGVVVLALAGIASADNLQAAKKMTADWPAGPREAAQRMMQKHGAPSGVTDSQLIWNQPAEPWHQINVYRQPIKHSFPVQHQDYLEHVILYEVPADKFDELAAYDGSVVAARTFGTLAARCDREEANILALNLAHDIVTGEKNVEEARQAYAQAIKQFKQGKTPQIMSKLMFEPMAPQNARDPGKTIIGQ